MHAYIHTYTHIHTYIHTYIHTCFLLLILMLWHRQAIFESKGDKLSSSAECRIRTQGLGHLFASRLNARWQTDWAIEDQAKNLNSTARPYDQQAFSPLDLTASWLSHLALAIYMFVVVNFDAQRNTFGAPLQNCPQQLNLISFIEVIISSQLSFVAVSCILVDVSGR